MRRVEAANPSLTVGALNLAPEFSATFGANFMMQVLETAYSSSTGQEDGCALGWAKHTAGLPPVVTSVADSLMDIREPKVVGVADRICANFENKRSAVQLTLLHFFRGLVALLILVVPEAALGGSRYLFVFHRDGTTASVFDAETLQPAGAPVVGNGAFAAFSIPGRAAAGFGKFYVVSEGSVVILDSEFAPRGMVFLPAAVPGSFSRAITTAAALTPDNRRLLIVSGSRMYILDTADDSLVAVLDLGFDANGVAASGDSALAHLTSLNSNLIRRVDLTSNELEEIGLYLPEVAMDIVTSPRDSRTYVTGRRAIYELDDRTERFLRPILSSTIDIETSITKRAKSFSGGAPSSGGSAPASAMPPLTKLHVSAGRRFLAQIDGRLFQGSLGPGGCAVEVETAAGGGLATPFADFTVSSDGAVLYAVNQPETRILKLNLEAPESPEQAILFAPASALSLVSMPTRAEVFAPSGTADDRASIGGLGKISGDNQSVEQGSHLDLPLVVSAQLGRAPRARVRLTVTTMPPAALSCMSNVLTDSSGAASLSCTAFNVDSATAATVSVRDDDGHSLGEPFRITIRVNPAAQEPLRKVSGDRQIAARDSALPVPLVLSAQLDGQPWARSQLSVETSKEQTLLCPSTVFTDEAGQASIACAAGSATVPAVVEVSVTGGSGHALSDPFTVTVPAASADVENLALLSMEMLEVHVGETVENGVQVRAFDAAGARVSGAAISFSSDKGVEFDPETVTTRSNGKAETTPTFGCLTGPGTIRVTASPGTGSLTVPFIAGRGPAARMTKVQGDNQAGIPGQLLDSQALVVQLTDECGNPLPGLDTSWAVEPPEAASLVNVIPITDGRGRSSVVVQLGDQQQPFMVTATSGPFSATFNLMVSAPPAQLSLISGNGQNVVVGQSIAQPLVAGVRDDQGGAVPGVQVLFVVVQGSATLIPGAAAVTDSQGLASVFVTASDRLGLIRVTANAAGKTVTFEVNVVGRVPLVTNAGFVNGVSFTPGWVPGSVGSIFGVGLMQARGVVEAGQVPFPTLLEGVRVSVNGVAAPILSMANLSGQEQINIQVPFGLVGRCVVEIENNGSRATFRGITLFSVQPAIFEVSLDGVRIAAALHADFTLVTPLRPALPGEIILLFLTGLGPTSPAVGTNVLGQVPLARSIVDPIVGIDDTGAEVLGSFYAPGLVTAYQVNFRIPANARPGNRKLSFVAAGARASEVAIPIGR